MLFNSLLFLFLFLPIVLFFNFIAKKELKNYFLLAASLIFFAWGGVSYSVILVFSILINYVFGLLIAKSIRKSKSKLYLASGVVINLAILTTFKYGNFIVENINLVFAKLGVESMKDLGIILPIGISFYTFQALSYLVDVYRKTTPVQKNLGNLALYIACFPQLIAGPIVRYHDISLQIENRENSLKKFTSGIERFLIGLGKKVLIANNLAIVADTVFTSSPESLSTTAAWIGIIAYSLQIYTDFSAYSDMAIGLGRMFGFEFLENFNFPYISKSIKEFWRRWHMSLSYWFRDYLYIPLGGNKKGKYRTYVNLMIVFVLTGFWHGASWAFVVWGLYHGFFLIIERVGFGKILEKAWSPLSHLYAIFVAMMGWVLFRAETFQYASDFYKVLFSFQHVSLDYEMNKILFSNQFIMVAIIAILGSSGLFHYIYKIAKKQIKKASQMTQKVIVNTYDVAETLFLISIFILSVLYINSGSYSPFIYFRF